MAHVKHVGCGFISKNSTLPRLSESKHKKRQNHNIHRNRLSQAAPIFFLIILTNSNVLATDNINSQKRYDITDLESFDTPVDCQIPAFRFNNIHESNNIININNKLLSNAHITRPPPLGTCNITIKKYLHETRNHQMVYHCSKKTHSTMLG